MSIYIQNGAGQINVDGTTTTDIVFQGKQSKMTLGGKTKSRWIAPYKKMSITLTNINEDEYTILQKILLYPEEVIIMDSDSKMFMGVYIDKSIKLQQNTDVDGVSYYSGTLNFSE